MKVLYLADPFLPIPPRDYGGIERIAATVIRDALAHGHEAMLVAHPDSHLENVPLRPMIGGERPCWRDYLANLHTIIAAHREFQPDLIHSFARLAYLAPLLRARTPKIMAFHRHPTPRTVRWAARLGGSSLTFTGCSQFITRRGAAIAGRWHAVPNCIDLDRFTFQPLVATDAPLVFLTASRRSRAPIWPSPPPAPPACRWSSPATAPTPPIGSARSLPISAATASPTSVR